MATAFTSSIPPPRPVPSHRHAAPMGPWPWVGRPDEHDKITNISKPSTLPQPHRCSPDCEVWLGYPQSNFPNWTPTQTKKSKITDAVEKHYESSSIFTVDVMKMFGEFERRDERVIKGDEREYWKEELQIRREPGVRVRALFVENLGGHLLQMLGHKHNIEPFFFSSSLNWIPSRYDEDVRPGKGDHITITLTFLRAASKTEIDNFRDVSTKFVSGEEIKTQAPLILHSRRPTGEPVTHALLLDLLAIHMVRDADSSTMISYHPPLGEYTTSAKDLYTRVTFVGESVYWKNIFKHSTDPTFLLLATFWHALYAWDEALEFLDTHFCWLESQVISTNDMDRTQNLHTIRAHLLYYVSLLEDFQKSVEFIRDTHNPAMQPDTNHETERPKVSLKNECDKLISEIKRLESWRKMLDRRVKNLMDLVFATVNIRDAAAMKQLSYLTMVFLPSSLVAGLFGMNVKELNDGTHGTIIHYVMMAIPLTLFTMWVIIAYQSKYYFRGATPTMWRRLGWPLTYPIQLYGHFRHGATKEDNIELPNRGSEA